MRNYRGVSPNSISDPATRDTVYAIHAYLQQVDRVLGARATPNSVTTAGGAPTSVSTQYGGWETLETIRESGLLTKKLTRSIFLPPEVFHGSVVTTTAGADPHDMYQYIPFTSASKKHITTTFMLGEIPAVAADIYPQSVAVDGIYLWLKGGTNVSDYAVFNAYTKALANDGATHPDEPNTATSRVVFTSQGLPVVYRVNMSPDGILLADIAPGKPIRLVIERDTDDAEDLNPDTVELIGVEINYTLLL